jgi:uncharacterized protein YbaA (DUF1428 family)
MSRKSFGYVDGFVVPVPRKNLATYKKWARVAGKVWRDHGALDYVECGADDVPAGKVTSFARSVKLKRGELVFFSWATYRSKAHRNQVMKRVMDDPRMSMFMNTDKMPFDGMRMFWGGFKPVVKL